MKRLLLSTIILFTTFICQTLFAQSPGGVGTTNLTAWFNPNNLPHGNATTWTTTFPTGASAITLTDNVTPYAQVTSTPTNGYTNYNKSLDFTGNVANAAGAMALERTGTLNLIDNNLSTAQGTFLAVYFMSDAASGQHLVDYRESNGDAIQFRKLSNMGYATTTANSVNATKDFPADDRPMIMAAFGNKATATSLKLRLRSMEWTGAGTASSAGTGGQLGLTVGMRKANSTSYAGAYQSFISELIFFNTDLPLADLYRVESYLAIKYGVTLDINAASAGAYISSASNIIWDASTALSYHQDVFGIARDDASGLVQKQSRTFNDSTRVYLSSLAIDNEANTGIFLTDQSFLMTGHNNGLLQETATATAEMPATMNLVNRLEREWRITNTGMANTYSMDFTLASLTNLTTNPADLLLLVDDDGNFSNASVFQAGLNFAINGNTVTVSGISSLQIPLNSTRYITLAVATIPAPLTLVNFNAAANNNVVDLNWQTAIEENAEQFIVERATDNVNWTTIITVKSTGSNSKYETQDVQPNLGQNFYRLKMVDVDGRYNYSETKIVVFENGFIKVYPNPVDTKLNIEANSRELKSLKIYNVMGQDVTSQATSKMLNENSMEMDFSKLPKGNYIIKTISGSTAVSH